MHLRIVDPPAQRSLMSGRRGNRYDRDYNRDHGREYNRDHDRDYNREIKDMRNSHVVDSKHNRGINRSRSPPPISRAKSPSRWDDPLKQFSEKHKPEKPPKHRAPPNRFNIPPGKQWDGIDRSNGFEVAYFKKLAQQERKKDLDYKYTVADM